MNYNSAFEFVTFSHKQKEMGSKIIEIILTD